jgi:allantoin racemase
VKLLVVNGNTTDAITARIAAAARGAAGAGTEIVAVTAGFGARVVGTRAEDVIAAHAVLETAARHHAGCDAVVVAISSDAGLAAARELLPIPVIGIRPSTSSKRRISQQRTRRNECAHSALC